MTTFNINKNVDEAFSLRIPTEFQQTLVPPFKIIDTITVSVATPNLAITSSATVALSCSTVFGIPTVAVTGPSVYDYNTNATDCNITSGLPVSFNSIASSYSFGSNDFGDGSYSIVTWIPFPVTLAKYTTIVSATIHFVASENSNQNKYPCNIKIGCENSPTGTAVTPTTYDQLNGRVLGAANTIANNVPFWTAEVTYSYDITASIQEVLNRTNWGATMLAVIARDNGSASDARRTVWSYDHASNYPTLTITV
jgi:hypothetical protein